MPAAMNDVMTFLWMFRPICSDRAHHPPRHSVRRKVPHAVRES